MTYYKVEMVLQKRRSKLRQSNPIILFKTTQTGHARTISFTMYVQISR